MTATLTIRLADRLRDLRHDRGWSLADLAAASGVSRATLSRLENAEVSPTTEVLGKLCSAYRLTLSRLMAMVESAYAPVVRRAEQEVWHDAETGFIRRVVSPPSEQLAAEVIAAELAPGAHITYPGPAHPGQEHHLVMQKGTLEVTVEGITFSIGPGDCLRYRLDGPTGFRNPGNDPTAYLLVLI